MASWSVFEAAAPAMAAAGQKLTYQYGPGSGYLASIDSRGMPSISEAVAEVRDDTLLVRPGAESGQAEHLVADPRVAFHTDGPEEVDDEFYVAGRALEAGEGWLEIDIERALTATYRPRAEGNTWPPKYERWRDPSWERGVVASAEAAALPPAVGWERFAEEEAALARLARDQIRFVGIGLGYLATRRRDGAPRIHPFCPTFSGDRLFGLIAPSPKQHDLLRDPRCAVHACHFPKAPHGVLLTCIAVPRDDPGLDAQVRASAAADGMTSSEDERLFEFLVAGVRLIQRQGSRTVEVHRWQPRPLVAG
jgi:hypothetical protein